MCNRTSNYLKQTMKGPVKYISFEFPDECRSYCTVKTRLLHKTFSTFVDIFVKFTNAFIIEFYVITRQRSPPIWDMIIIAAPSTCIVKKKLLGSS